MNIRIYQINMDRDTERKAFEGIENLERLFGGSAIDSSIYDKVFEGEVDCDSLEGIYQKFNLDHPESYRGSHSYTDLADYNSAQDNYREMDVDFTAHDYVGLDKYLFEPGFYFCDSIGFQKVDFDPQLVQEAEKHGTIKVVLLEPGKLARVTEIDSSLEGLQHTVGGMIEAFYPFEEEVCIVCNDESKINGMELNRAIREEDTIVDLSYKEMAARFREAESHGEHLEGCVVFTQDSFKKEYSLESRTYKISSDNKAYQSTMRGYSIFASSLDGSDRGVRLDAYMADEHGGKDGWKVERCYMYERGKEILDIIAGPCFICDCSGEDFGSLSDEQLRKYAEKFRYPEQFVRINEEIHAIPYKPTSERER